MSTTSPASSAPRSIDFAAPVAPGIAGQLELTLPGGPATLGCGDRDVIRTMLPEIVKTGTISTDIETFGLGELAVHLKAVQIADWQGRNVVVLDPRVPWQAKAIGWAYRRATAITLHNSTFDAPNLYRNGLLGLEDLRKIWDTVLWARLAWPGEITVSKSLEALAARWLGFTDGSIKGLFTVNGWRSVAEGYRNADLDMPQYIVGAALDAVATARLAGVLRGAALRQLTTDHPFASRGVTGDDAEYLVDREQVMNRVFLHRACLGVRIDFEYYTRYLNDVTAQQAERVRLLTDAGVRPGVGQDLAEAASRLSQLHSIMDSWPKTKTGKYRMTKTDVPKLAARWPVARAFAEHKQVEKTLIDYLGKLNTLADDHGRIHPVTNLLLAAHGRTSMGSPPLQQFPGGAREMILFDDGDRGASIDWSQIEPVMAANLAGDVAALAHYEAGGDFYEGIATKAGIPRKSAKTVLLAQLYGEGLDKLATDLGITTEDAAELKTTVFRALPKVKQWLNQVRSIGDRYRKVPTLSGRIVTVPVGVWQGRPSVATHKAINYVVSGSAYDMLAEAVVQADREGLSDAIYWTMHDEMLVAESAAVDIQRIMATPPARMIEICRRTPVLRTDLSILDGFWKVV